MDTHKDDKTYYGAFNQSIMALFNLRATEGVKAFSENLSFLPLTEPGDPRYMRPSTRRTELFYPCTMGLYYIGEPSDVKRRMLNVISSKDDEIERALACWVLMEIHGKDTALQIIADDGKRMGREAKVRSDWAVDYVQNYAVSLSPPGQTFSRTGVVFGSLQKLIEKRAARQFLAEGESSNEEAASLSDIQK